MQIPAGLPVLPGAVLAGRYVLSGVEPLNKGDTLDAVPLPGDRVALIVADVVGSGFGAALAVSQIKAVLRERLRAGAELHDVLVSADHYARTQPDLCGTTLCVAILGLVDGELEWANAGHPPPVWMSPGAEPRFLPTPQTKPLGTGVQPQPQRTRLDVGDMIGLYTNGLVYSQTQPLPIGYDRLLDALALATIPQASVPPFGIGDQVCERVLRDALPEGTGDDAALLIATRSRAPEPFHLRQSAHPQNLPMVRHEINQWLDNLGAGLVDHVGLGHAVVELAANVIGHAYDEDEADPVLRVDALLDSEGIVRITVSDRGRWRPESSTGRGLMMAAGLADSLKVHRSGQGTAVTLTQRITRAVPLLQQVAADDADVLDEAAEFEAHAEPGHVVVTGPIDDLSIELFDEALTKATRAGTVDAVVDLSGVTHLASPGVQTLFEFRARSKQTGAALTLRTPSDSPVGQILRLVDLSISM